MGKVIRIGLRGLYFAVLYTALFFLYTFLQETYIETCTPRAGLFNMIVSMPACNHLLFILKFIGEHFVSLMVSFTAVTLAMLH